MARTKRSKTKTEAVGQADPKAPLDSAALLAAATPVLSRLEEDLLARAKSSPEVTRALEARYEAEKQANRTAESYAGWSAALATQVAAAWLLSCVFVRTLEDRGLLKQARIAGPGAEDSQREFFKLAPSLSARDYLLTVFRELAHHPAAKDLFDVEHSLVWKLSPSAEAVKDLLTLFRTPTAHEPSFRFGQPSTRFLGDLYQDISADVRKRYALLQTPDFIEEFILDRTLEPAIQRFGLDDTTLIDPTCGSGHFLLGAFDRLFEHRLRAEPGLDARIAAVKALGCVYGADINPYAVAIARFRLTLSFLEKAAYTKLADAPALPLHLVVADSLRINPQHPQQELWQQDGASSEHWLGNVFTLEDEEAAREVLFRQYAAVVGNPPYIVPKDSALRDCYRAMYRTAAMQYSLAAPFCERIFQLARPRGYTGQITANSFMKREFGRKLIEEFLPAVNLQRIVNTSGAYVPGHGTPTVLLFGTHEATKDPDVHAVLGKRGEPSTPADPSRGLVWRSIVDHGDDVGFENEYISVARVRRDALARHPWSLGGGGASELKELLESRSTQRLGELVVSIGRVAHTGNDEAFVAPQVALLRQGLDEAHIATFVEGEALRDWALGSTTGVLFPYDSSLRVCAPDVTDPRLKLLWPYRTMLWERREPNGTHREIGLTWYEFSRFHPERFRGMCIGFAFVATHNHFVLDRGGKVFNRSAPIIKLPDGATEDDHLALLAYLNSSTACFWMKQVFFDKGNRGEGGGTTSESWEKFFEFDGTKIRALPIPVWQGNQRAIAIQFARELLALSDRARELGDLSKIFTAAESAVAFGSAVAARVSSYKAVVAELRQMQERLDWWLYTVVGLAAPEVADVTPSTTRASDLLFARQVLRGDVGIRYFELCHLPHPEEVAKAHVPPQHLEAVSGSAELALLEQPVFKRTFREGFRPIDVDAQAVPWLAGHFEAAIQDRDEPVTERNLISAARADRSVEVVATWLAERQDLSAIVSANAVPFLAALRYSASGVEKHGEWERCWDAQRRQDAGAEEDFVPPPKYVGGDFASGAFFRLRGPLDVPKERFISYPFCESDTDGELVYGWAGWDHLRRARALGALYLNRRDEGWSVERLTPMLAGLLELIPWIKQWHNEPSEEFGGQRMGDYYQQVLDEECRRHSLTHDDLRAWRPPKNARVAKKAVKTKTADRNGAGASDEAPSKPKRARKKKSESPTV